MLINENEMMDLAHPYLQVQKPTNDAPTTINENTIACAIIPPDNWPPLNEDPKALLLLSDTATETS